MTYLDAFYDRKNDKMYVAEIDKGQIVVKKFPVEHTFYYESPTGMNRSIYGHPCKKFSTFDSKKFKYEINDKLKANVRIFESDIKPEFRFLEKHYKGMNPPELNVCFFDIEVDMNINQKYEKTNSLYAPTHDPFCPVTAITMYMTHLKAMITLVLCPSTLAFDKAKQITDKFDNTLLFDNEKELLKTFIDLIQDVHVYSGWNSEGYDIPYMINRVERILGLEETKHFCLFDKLPVPREYKKFGKIFKTYDLIGRAHLDYLILYQKHNPQQQASYSLDNIGEVEVGERKIPYEGTLDKLYNDDFEKFIAYNRQDVGILIKIDEKKKFIELSNQIAHANCVQFKTTIGSVALVEQAIINEMHDMGFTVPNRPPKEWKDEDDDEDDEDDDSPVVGAYVAKPKVGLHEHIGCGDINSLYPSAIRALNMSPETLVGQIRLTKTMALVDKRIESGIKRAEAWEGIFIALEVQDMLDETDDILTIDFEDKKTETINVVQMTAKDFHEYVFDPKNNICVTANGTLFRTDKEGIIPALLAKWYSERKEYQANEKMYGDLAHGMEIEDVELLELLKMELSNATIQS